MTSSSNMLISQTERPRSSVLFERSRRERQRLSLLDFKKVRARRAEHVLVNMTGRRKGRAKELDQEARLNEANPQKDNFARKSGRSPSGTESSSVFQLQKEEIVVMIERVIIGAPRMANTSGKMFAKPKRATMDVARELHVDGRARRRRASLVSPRKRHAP